MDDYFDDYDDDDVIILEPDHRNGTMRRRGRRIPSGRRLPPPRPPGRIVMRPRPRPPVIVQQPAPVEETHDTGVTIGGMRIPLTMIAGAVLTIGGLGVQLASHFVSQPEVPDRSNAKVEDLAGYDEEKAESDRKVRMLESIGRALSDLGQLAALRRE